MLITNFIRKFIINLDEYQKNFTHVYIKYKNHKN